MERKNVNRDLLILPKVNKNQSVALILFEISLFTRTFN
jgi:hypothetical protein